MRYIENKLLEGINPSEIVSIANEILENGVSIVIDIHIHEDSYDFAEVLTIEKDNNKWIVVDALSGGRQEAVWNYYYKEFKELFDAIVYALGRKGEA